MKKKLGFTLIELMVVMAIIAILATAGLSAYTGYIKKARDAKRIEDMRAMKTVMVGMNIDWTVADYTFFDTKAQQFFDTVKEMNGGKYLSDPLDGKTRKIGSNIVYYAYFLIGCTKIGEIPYSAPIIGYKLATFLESESNQGLFSLWRGVVTPALPLYVVDTYNCPPWAEGPFYYYASVNTPGVQPTYNNAAWF